MKELYFVLVLLLEGFSAANIPSLRGDGSEVEHQPRFVRDKQVEPLQCGAKDKLKDSEYAMIESPDFPDPYPNNVKCKYTIKVPKDSDVYFSCDYLEILKPDFLKVGKTKLNGQYSSPFGFKVEMKRNKLKIMFKTNKKGAGNGFRCYIDVTKTSQNTTETPVTAAPPTLAPGTCSCGQTNNMRIVGGQETDPNQYPWQVALVNKKGRHPWCGGTLISPQHVLTAAHCTAGESPSSMAVLLGEHRINDNSFDRATISAITDHPGYNSGTLDNDFSILTLSEPVAFSGSVAPACLPADPSMDFSGALATVTGWGTLQSGGNQPEVLNEVQVTVQTNDQCNSAYGGGITDNMICAADAGKDSCQGDSGGPMVMEENGRFALAGVVSWGYGCAMPEYPGVYARVTAQLDWILANTAGTQNTNC